MAFVCRTLFIATSYRSQMQVDKAHCLCCILCCILDKFRYQSEGISQQQQCLNVLLASRIDYLTLFSLSCYSRKHAKSHTSNVDNDDAILNAFLVILLYAGFSYQNVLIKSNFILSLSKILYRNQLISNEPVGIILLYCLRECEALNSVSLTSAISTRPCSVLNYILGCHKAISVTSKLMLHVVCAIGLHMFVGQMEQCYT